MMNCAIEIRKPEIYEELNKYNLNTKQKKYLDMQIRKRIKEMLPIVVKQTVTTFQMANCQQKIYEVRKR
jgi:hypothetical protein